MTDPNQSLKEALSRSGQGFDYLLTSIQQGLGRVDKSLDYARAKKDQYALIDYQMNKQVEKYKETVAIQKQADRELREEQFKAARDLKTIETLGRIEEEKIRGQVKLEEAKIKSDEKLEEARLKSIEKLGEEQVKKITELTKLLDRERTQINTTFKPAIDLGLSPTLIPNVVLNDDGTFSYSLPNGKTYTNYQELVYDYDEVIQFSNTFKNIKTDDIDPYVLEQKQGEVTYVGRSKFTEDLNNILSNTEEGKRLAIEYQTGKRAVRLSKDNTNDPEKLYSNLDLGYAIFVTTARKYKFNDMSFSMNNVVTFIQKIDEKITKEKDQEKIREYNEDIKNLKQMIKLFSQASFVKNRLGEDFDPTAPYTPEGRFGNSTRTSADLD
jgi:hypothetical protein